MILTSHYMRDVEALCSRVLVITHGRLVYDGLLAGITEQFGRDKLLRFQFEHDVEAGELAPYGEVVSHEGSYAELKVDRARVAEVLGAILERYTVIDTSVQDPPLDQMIARVFEEGRAYHEVG
jgi:ABC-2 type transport system ATP-binding protein